VSGTSSLQVLATDPTPPYEQLRRQLASMIQSGVIATGDRLPPVRQLAADLGLAVGTVARTYRELEAAGLVATRRGGGTRVRPPPASPAPAARRQALREHAETYLRHARQLGATDDEVHQAVVEALAGP
jgi:DNA-binding transcriptional regulator YhcF (GntR family)